MTRNLLRAGALSCALLTTTAACGLASPAFAQQAIDPQKDLYIGDGEVELYRGTFLYSNTDISIGGSEEEGGLALIRRHGVLGLGPGRFDASSTHNHGIYILRRRYQEDTAQGFSYSYDVTRGPSTEPFTLDWPNTQISNDYSGRVATLTTSAGPDGPFTFTDRDGTVINFAACATLSPCRAVATSIVRPNGTVINYEYDTAFGLPRLRLVRSNRGFALGFGYVNFQYHSAINRICAVNLAQQSASVSSPCPTGAPAATYGYDSSGSSRLQSYTNALNQTTTYTFASGGGVATIRNPGSTSDDLVVTYHPASGRVTSQTYADNSSWSYAYQQNEHPVTAGTDSNEWTRVTDPLGEEILYTFLTGGAPNPGSVTDPLGRVTTISYLNGDPRLPRLRTFPEGNAIQHSYDERDNVREVRRIPRPGPGTVADLVETATYLPTCTNRVTCNLPLTRTDARESVTTIEYDPVHGGIVKETGPAIGGIQPQVRHEYQQRYAWLSNGAGGYAQATTPAWVRTATSTCRTSAATGNPASPCATAGDEVRTTYDYGPNSGPNNLLLRGQVVTADGQSWRTCFRYDSRGNRISETSPGAALAQCP